MRIACCFVVLFFASVSFAQRTTFWRVDTLRWDPVEYERHRTTATLLAVGAGGLGAVSLLLFLESKDAKQDADNAIFRDEADAKDRDSRNYRMYAIVSAGATGMLLAASIAEFTTANRILRCRIRHSAHGQTTLDITYSLDGLHL